MAQYALSSIPCDPELPHPTPFWACMSLGWSTDMLFQRHPTLEAIEYALQAMMVANDLNEGWRQEQLNDPRWGFLGGISSYEDAAFNDPSSQEDDDSTCYCADHDSDDSDEDVAKVVPIHDHEETNNDNEEPCVVLVA